jgi:hypothetical protein
VFAFFGKGRDEGELFFGPEARPYFLNGKNLLQVSGGFGAVSREDDTSKATGMECLDHRACGRTDIVAQRESAKEAVVGKPDFRDPRLSGGLCNSDIRERRSLEDPASFPQEYPI